MEPEYTMPGLTDFMYESWRIEGLPEPPILAISATETFLAGNCNLREVCCLQAVYAPGKPLRERRGMDVCVGNHYPPLGGPSIEPALQQVLVFDDPWRCHVEFEKLHPFMDGNGRVGRGVWAWKMLRCRQNPFEIPFLHQFYYQTLDHMT